MQVPKWMKKDQKALVSFLTKTSKTEVERVRALVRWVGDNIAYDTRFAAARGADADQSAAAVLLRGTAVCQGYANLVKQLARCQENSTQTFCSYQSFLFQL